MAEVGAEVTVRALAEGAADTLPKPGTGYFAGRFSQVLADKIRRIGRAVRQQAEAAPAGGGGPLRLRAMPNHPIGCIGLGASTGGLHALLEFLRALPPKVGAPIVVTQHLPPVFMSYFARQLQTASGRPACVAEDGQPLADEVVFIAPGDAHLAITSDSGRVRARHDRKRAPSGCLPSADPMLASIGDVYGQAAVGVILSGMGRDGLIGSRLLVESGGAMLAQDQASAAVWGMPRAVAEAGLASAVLPPAELARRIAERAEAAPWK
jgi:two-component system chemotaxis response regulator CheB